MTAGPHLMQQQHRLLLGSTVYEDCTPAAVNAAAATTTTMITSCRNVRFVTDLPAPEVGSPGEGGEQLICQSAAYHDAPAGHVESANRRNYEEDDADCVDGDDDGDDGSEEAEVSE